MPDSFISRLTLTLTQGTFKWATRYHDSDPAFQPRLLEGGALIKTLPDPLLGIQGAREASLTASNLDAATIEDGFDTVTSANYNALADVDATWAWDTTNSRLSVTGGTNALRVHVALAAEDWTVECTISQANDAGLVGRVSDVNNYYLLAIRDSASGSGGTNNLQLYKRVAGTLTSIGGPYTVSFTRGTTHTVRLEVTGTTIKAYFDNVVVASVTDSALSGIGRAGLRNDDVGASFFLSFIARAFYKTTLSQIFQVENPLGAQALYEKYDPETALVVQTFSGVLSGLELTPGVASISLRTDDVEAMQELIPKYTVLDRFPSAELVNAEDTEIWVFGKMYRVDLPLVEFTQLSCSFTMAGNPGDNFQFHEMTGIANYVVQTGDYLYYDVLWGSSTSLFGIDLQATDVSVFRTSGAVDQNGVSCNPADAGPWTYMGSGSKWYRRKIAFPAGWVGKTIDFYYLLCEANADGTYVAWLSNAYIGDIDGNIRKEIITQNTTAVPTALALEAHASDTASITFFVLFDYGSLRVPGAGALSVSAVYRNGAVVPATEYTFNEFLTRHVRFTQKQVDGQGQPDRIQADLSSTEYNDSDGRANPANAIKSILNDATNGLGKAVSSSSFTTAETDYRTLTMAVAGGLMQRIRAGDVLSLLLLYGGMLDRNSSNQYTMQVDGSALHTAGSISLGQGDGYWNNCDIERDTRVSIEERVKKLVLRGLFDPGLEGSGSYLLSGMRERTDKGVTREIENPFIGDTTTLDEQIYYLYQVLIAADRSLQVMGASTTKVLTLNQLVPLLMSSMAHYGTSYLIAAVEVVDSFFRFGLRGHNAAIYTHVAGEVKVNPKATLGTNYSLTLPGTPTNFATPTFTFRSTGTPNVELEVTTEADPPTTNVTHLVFRAYKPSSIGYAAENVVATTPGSIDVVGKLLGLEMGVSYSFQVFARNVSNKVGFQDGTAATQTQTTGNAPGAPGTPTGLTVTQRPPKRVFLNWTNPTDANLTHIEVHKNTSNSFSDSTILHVVSAPGRHGTDALALASSYLDEAISYGDQPWYALRAVNAHGQKGSFTSGVRLSSAVTRLATDDVDDDQINTNKRVIVSSTAHTFGTLPVTHQHTENLAASYTQNATSGVNGTGAWGVQSFSFTHGLSKIPIAVAQIDNVDIPYVAIITSTNISVTQATSSPSGTTPTITCRYW